PEYLLSFEPEQLRFILRHELEHLRTGHPLQVFLQHTVEVLFWFHPLVWWASGQSAVTREFACDDAAMETPRETVDYLKTLLAIVEHTVQEQDRGVLAFARHRRLMAVRARRLVEKARNIVPAPGPIRVTQLVMNQGGSALLCGITVVLCLLWLPVNVTASPRAAWSPWPTWSASALHNFGINTRDFEIYDENHDLFELKEEAEKPLDRSP
ncbi:MAG: M56 family metallopeptidase, partial [Planctomycetaceae bacterium]|nr:M56 family metallopeptidase [Planctomycetaceae bacterium]